MFYFVMRVAFLGVLLCTLIAISIADLRKRIISAKCLLIIVCVWVGSVLLILAQNDVSLALSYALRGVVGFLGVGALLLLWALFYERVFRKQSLGGGDIKLLAILGLFLGLEGVLVCLLFACVVALFATYVRNARIAKKPFLAYCSDTFAFAPAICVSAAPLLAACMI